ncbi:MAG: hypothetical protein AAB448_02900 [Patescibacteria group bacterium]
MLPECEPNLEELARKYFVDELGLSLEDIPEATRNLVGAFEVLLGIDNRTNPKPQLV